MDIHNKSIISEKLRNLTRYCIRKGHELLILSDCNSWSTLWNMPFSNARGRVLEGYIAETGLEVLNKGRDVTFHREGVGTIVDITLASPNLADSISHWKVNNICPSSDHLAPQMILKLDAIKTEYKWNFHKSNWPGFQEDVEKASVREINNFDNKYERLDDDTEWHYQRVEDVSEAIEEDIWHGIANNTKKEAVKPKAPRTSWFTPQLEAMKRQLGYISNAIRKSKNRARNPKGRRTRYTYADFKA